VKLLLDTHILAWLATDVPLLPGERALLAEVDDLAVSVVSLWELRVKWNRFHASGERKGPLDPQVALVSAGRMPARVLPLTPTIAVAPLDPPLDHSDPFDELLLVHAQVTGRRLLTRDRKLGDHPIALSFA